MIESFQLPFQFKVEELRQELERLRESEWLPHFNTGYYTGNWNGISLRSPEGKMESLYPVPDAEYKDTALMPHFPSVKKILQTFECPVKSIRFLRLEKGAVIKEHFDNALSIEDGEVRIHIPVMTNDGVEFISNGKKLQMLEGQCWYINAGLPHSVRNDGESDRIHLVLDCSVNNWLKSFFPEIVIQNRKGTSSIKTDEDLKNMIEALRNIGSETALQMAEQYERHGLIDNKNN
jgi:mannose-6-phosphate isomerase-like protein (cupin superfamily)